MKEGLIGVIVPVYNTEKYIRQCLDSILAQTYTNWEAILVDDGSTDNSGKICDEYAAKDKRFKVIHQENGGVSVARQTGLDNVTGDYIIHCDPDDWIEPQMLKELIDKALEGDYDMVICDYYEFRGVSKFYVSQRIVNPITSKEVQNKIVNQELHGNCWNKLIRKDYCCRVSFTPKDISLAEDELYIVRILNNNLRVAYIDNALYNYRRDNVNSICSSKCDKIIMSRTKVIEEYEKFLNPIEYNNFFNIKYDILLTLFKTKNLKQLKNTYKEIHPIIIYPERKYSPVLPLGYFFQRAIKGNTYIAYYLYKLHLIAINIIKKIKNIKVI
ncbi:MAG: glycosyltransferase [Bacteroidaceae bacterium]|nr:glycosyltransferase [Bacteroidaceae bacterium]